MSATVYDGKALVAKISRRVIREAQQLRKRHHIEVGLGLLLITGDQVAMADSGKIASLAEQADIKIHIERVARRNVARRFYPTLEEYAASPFIQGIYIQLPLPTEIVPLADVMRRLPPEKDVAGLHFVNRGMSTYARHEVTGSVQPPEILAACEALMECGFEIRSGNIVLVGSKATSGLIKVLAGYLYDKGANVRLLRYANIGSESDAPKTERLKSLDDEKPKENPIINPKGEAVIAWANHPGWLTRARLSPQSIVIDLGYRFARGKVSGDCDFLSVSQSAKILTPVPGGVRNITHAMILSNLIDLIKTQMEKREEVDGKVLKRRFNQ